MSTASDAALIAARAREVQEHSDDDVALAGARDALAFLRLLEYVAAGPDFSTAPIEALHEWSALFARSGELMAELDREQGATEIRARLLPALEAELQRRA